jgi:hypothetical protein
MVAGAKGVIQRIDTNRPHPRVPHRRSQTAWRYELKSCPRRPSHARSRRSTTRGVKKPGGEIDPFGMLQVGESGF